VAAPATDRTALRDAGLTAHAEESEAVTAAEAPPDSPGTTSPKKLSTLKRQRPPKRSRSSAGRPITRSEKTERRLNTGRRIRRIPGRPASRSTVIRLGGRNRLSPATPPEAIGDCASSAVSPFKFAGRGSNRTSLQSRGRPRRKPRELRLSLAPGHEGETYGDWFRRVVLRNRGTTWITAFYVHWIMLLLLAVLVVHGPDSPAALLITASFSSPDEETFDGGPFEVSPLKLEVAEVREDLSLAAQTEYTSLSKAIVPSLRSVPIDDNQKKKEAPPPPPPPEPEVPDPTPPNAVTRGSFSVWTDPPSPRVGLPYRIIVQIRLPPGVTEFDWSDLQGMVIGSDGYRKPIPPSNVGKIVVQNGFVRFAVPIVSADYQVKDTVFIRSRLLKETQQLNLHF
ncbi:MAG: hypothetical protein KDA89_21115, partial [Planctomycetaceae bacterium]|nr:hypothetical protein [Planctomycetaceae bacterium]